MKQIRMILLDMDGTLLTHDNRITPHTIQALKKAHADGYWIGLASGRPRWLLERSIAEYQIEELVDGIIGLNGAHIWDRGLDRFEALSPLSADDRDMILKRSDAVDANVVGYDDKGVYAKQLDKTSKWMADYFHAPQHRIADMPADYPYMKLEIIRTDPNYTEAELAILRSIQSETCEPIASAPFSMEYIPRGRSKSTGAQRLALWHGWTLDQIVAFGDHDNDVPLLKTAGIGVCMANGSSAAKQAATCITASNEEDGIAKWLETFLFEKTGKHSL